MLAVITGEFCMLRFIISEIRKLAVIADEFRMLGVNWQISHVNIVITANAQ